MKKTKTILIMAALPLLMGSCVIASYHYTTGAPIGTKEGYVKSSRRSFDAGYSAVAKEAKITRIGSVDIKYYYNHKFSVKVTGE